MVCDYLLPLKGSTYSFCLNYLQSGLVYPVLGYIFCIIIDHSADSARCPNTELYINNLCVDENFRREGIGDALFQKALSTAQKLGCHNLTLNVWEGNDSALRFYEKHGMKIQKRELEIVLD